MLDKSTQLIIDALGRAASEPAGLPLHANKSESGLFNGTMASRQAAQRCLEKGFLRVVRREARGKANQEICALTDEGVRFLLKQTSPKQVLEDFVRSLDLRRAEIAAVSATARQIESNLSDLKSLANQFLARLEMEEPSISNALAPVMNTVDGLPSALLAFLAQRQTAGDCPLPELYKHFQSKCPALSIGCFHDDLRRLHESGKIYLHPWTGPLYDLPDPALAMLVGHEVAYYASLRQ